ncbi:MAG: hypothetical protein AAGA60_10830 [Cyanobacteria bacterium P01_E01_bin.42]
MRKKSPKKHRRFLEEVNKTSQKNPNRTTGLTLDKKKIVVEIKQSALTGRWNCVTTIVQTNIKAFPITVWNTLERARAGAKEIHASGSRFTTATLITPSGYQDFIAGLSDDDDEIIAVVKPSQLQIEVLAQMFQGAKPRQPAPKT